MKYVCSFEGLNGCGKSSIINGLLPLFNKNEYNIISTRFPGGGISEIRDLVRNPNKRLCDYTYMFLNMADQFEFENIYNSISDNDKDVIFLVDRMIDSTFVYQSCLNNIELNFIKHISSYLRIIPDDTFFIDIDYDTSIKRRQQAIPNEKEWTGSTKDRWEIELDKDREIFNKMRKCYIDLSKEYDKRIININGNDTIENLVKNIYDQILHLIGFKKCFYS